MLLNQDEDTLKKIEGVVDSLRPGFMAVGGDISFIKYKNNVVFIHLIGSHVAYPASEKDILKMIQRQIRMVVPEVESVELFTYQ